MAVFLFISMLENIYIKIIFVLVILILLFLIYRCFKHQGCIINLKKKHEKEIEESFAKVSCCDGLIEASKLSMGVYHDICNILSASNLALEQIKAEVSDRENVAKIANKALEINLRITQLLRNYRSCHAGNKKAGFYINEEIKNILSIFNFCLIKNDIKLDLKLDKEVFIRGDLVKFFRLLVNLLSNAVESFLAENKDNRKIIIKTTAKNGLVLEIQDNGCGIAEEKLKSIFKPFFSSKKSASSENKNLGIGLTLVKKIIEEDFSARIEVSSKIQEGSTFKIFF